MEKILLHACCAVCMAYPLELLKKDYDPIVFFYNPNIFPKEEHDRRRDELIKYCEKIGCKYIIGDLEPEKWREFIKGLEQEPEKGLRCNKCFEFRLQKTAQTAKQLEIRKFTTTLSVSPHKVSRNIFAEGKKQAELFGLEFVECDFKKQNGFLNTMKLAKENNFYRQNYCGCEFSIRKEQ